MSIENIDNEKLQGWAAFINNLTLRKIALTVLLAVGLVIAYNIYESKPDFGLLMNAHPNVVLAFLAFGGLVALGSILNSLHKRIDNKQQEVLTETGKSITRLEVQLDKLEQRERDCNERHNQLVLELAKRGFFRSDSP